MINCKFSNGLILLFAKAAIAGQVKTRLQPVLSEATTLALHKALLTHAVQTVVGSQLCKLELWITSNEPDELFLSLCNKKDIHAQIGADLGARMAHAARSGLQRAEYVILLGADCPAVDAAYLQEALQLLEQGEQIVFGPAEDGGYVLLGLRCVPPNLFTDMPWGTAEVMTISRHRMQQSGQSWVELTERWDVDRPEDLPRLKQFGLL